MMHCSVSACLAMTMMTVATHARGNYPGIRRPRKLQVGCVAPPTTLPVHIVSEHSGLSLMAKSDNNVVQTYASSGGDDNWVFESAGGGLYRIVIEGTSLAMTGTSMTVLSTALLNMMIGSRGWCTAARSSSAGIDRNLFRWTRRVVFARTGRWDLSIEERKNQPCCRCCWIQQKRWVQNSPMDQCWRN